MKLRIWIEVDDITDPAIVCLAPHPLGNEGFLDRIHKFRSLALALLVFFAGGIAFRVVGPDHHFEHVLPIL